MPSCYRANFHYEFEQYLIKVPHNEVGTAKKSQYETLICVRELSRVYFLVLPGGSEQAFKLTKAFCSTAGAFKSC